DVDSTQKPGTAEINSAELVGACCSMSSASNVQIATLDSNFVRSATAVPVTTISSTPNSEPCCVSSGGACCACPSATAGMPNENASAAASLERAMSIDP